MASRVRRWILGIVLTVVLVGVGIVLYGLTLPREHVAASEVELSAPADSVWRVIRDMGRHREWWPAVTKVEAVDRGDGQERWSEEIDGFTMIFRPEVLEEGRRFRTVIEAEPGAPFGGTWTYEVEPRGAGTLVRVTEDGWVANPFFRAMLDLGGRHGSLDSYLTALAARFGRSVAPVHVAEVR